MEVIVKNAAAEGDGVQYLELYCGGERAGLMVYWLSGEREFSFELECDEPWAEIYLWQYWCHFVLVSDEH